MNTTKDIKLNKRKYVSWIYFMQSSNYFSAFKKYYLLVFKLLFKLIIHLKLFSYLKK